jgi:hypothetical protein
VRIWFELSRVLTQMCFPITNHTSRRSCECALLAIVGLFEFHSVSISLYVAFD